MNNMVIKNLKDYCESKLYRKWYDQNKRTNYNIKNWDFETFKRWYLLQPQKCSYCGITKKQLDTIYATKGILDSKRRRGRCFEIDRIKDIPEYNSKNCCLACYWCNNARSDCFTIKEFRPIGKAIGKKIRKIIKDNKAKKK